MAIIGDSSGAAKNLKREHCLVIHIGGALKVSNMICIMRSRFASGSKASLRGAQGARNARWPKWLPSCAPQHSVPEMAALLRTATQGGRNGCARLDTDSVLFDNLSFDPGFCEPLMIRESSKFMFSNTASMAMVSRLVSTRKNV